MTTEETQNLERIKRWEALYNTDVEQMVRQMYVADLVVDAMGGGTIRGQEQFIAVEKMVLSAAPKRKMRISHRHATGPVLVLEGVLLDPDRGADWELPFITVLECHDGKIVHERAYANWDKWPGLESAPLNV